MFYIDSDKCTGCGACVDACRQKAISIPEDVAVIEQAMCTKCGDCAAVCPAGAIRARAPVYAESGKGGDVMIGRGWSGGGRGMGFGFRGSSPPWPYVGRGRGGLPRCQYPGFYGGSPAWGAMPYTPQTPEQEKDFLQEEARAVKKHLEDLEARIKELEAR